MNEKTGKKLSKKDCIIFIILLICIIANSVCNIIQDGFTNISDILTQTMLIFMSFVGLIEIAHLYGFDIFVPDFILEKESRKHMDEIQKYMGVYFKNETNYINDYSDEKIGFIISQLGISVEQMDKIRIELIKMRCLPLNNLQDAKYKIEQYIKSGPPMLIDLRKIDSAKRARPNEKFFINFNDPMFLPNYCHEIAAILGVLIKEKADLKSIDRIVIPYDSNFLLGVELSEELGKPLVKMRPEKGRYITERCWDGDLKKTDRVIIVHDVLVSADQIIHTLTKLPKSCHVEGLYCLIARKDSEGLERLTNMKVERVMDLDDNDIFTIIDKE